MAWHVYAQGRMLKTCLLINEGWILLLVPWISDKIRHLSRNSVLETLSFWSLKERSFRKPSWQ